MKTKTLPAVVLILSDARGRFIPRDFITDNYNEIAVDHCAAWGLTSENAEWWTECLSPDSLAYWEAWEWILNNAEFKDANGDVYRLYQDGDLFGLCFERMTAEEKQNFGMED